MRDLLKNGLYGDFWSKNDDFVVKLDLSRFSKTFSIQDDTNALLKPVTLVFLAMYSFKTRTQAKSLMRDGFQFFGYFCSFFSNCVINRAQNTSLSLPNIISCYFCYLGTDKCPHSIILRRIWTPKPC